MVTLIQAEVKRSTSLSPSLWFEGSRVPMYHFLRLKRTCGRLGVPGTDTQNKHTIDEGLYLLQSIKESSSLWTFRVYPILFDTSRRDTDRLDSIGGGGDINLYQGRQWMDTFRRSIPPTFRQPTVLRLVSSRCLIISVTDRDWRLESRHGGSKHRFLGCRNPKRGTEEG